jgi:DNA-binding response OmpR family regulator
MKTVTILIVDDDPGMRKLLRDYLSFQGHQIDCATNGLEALKLIEQGLYGLIIVDYEMPGMNGVELVKKVREKWTALPILAMSSSDVQGLFLRAGADRFLTKPIKLETLLKEIECIV